MKQSVDMINGSLGDKIIKFVIPLAAAGILQQLFNAMDVVVVGRFANKEAMAAVGSNSAIVGLVLNLFIGISLGANVVIARYTGQRNKEGIRKGVHTAVLFGFLAGILAAIVGILVSRPLLAATGVQDDIMPMAVAYLRIYMSGMPMILLYNFEASVFRSQGDTRTPLIVLIIAGILNVILNLFFVIVVGMTADGVALATVISNAAGAITLFVLLTRSKSDIKVHFKDLRLHKPILKEMMRIGLPAGLQQMVFSFSNIIIQSAINSLGTNVIAGSAAAFNIEVFVYFIINAFGQACTTFVGQNHGAGKLDRCRKITKLSTIQCFITTIGVSAIVVALGAKLMWFFNEDPDVIASGVIRINFIASLEIINAINEMLSGALRGYGRSLWPAVITLVGVCGTRLVWVYTAFPAHRSFGTLMTCYPISWIVTAVILAIYYFAIFRPRFFATEHSAGA